MTTPHAVTASRIGFSAPPDGRQLWRMPYLGGYLLLLLVALVLALLQPAVWAQDAPPRDPPGRVARLNLAQGAVSLSPADPAQAGAGNGWLPAPLNQPLTSGDRLWTGAQARSELHVGSTALRMGGQTSLDFLALDDDVTRLRLAQGTLQLRVRTLFEGQRLEIDTPNLAFVVSQPGDYRLDVSPAGDSTRVVAQAGAGMIYGDGVPPVRLGSPQQANFSGTRLEPAAPSAAYQDSFDAWAASRDRREDRSVSARYLPREIVGYQQLDDYGDWAQDPGYGAVWVPRAVPVNWAPYRAGHWRWIDPWGWTWVDDAPWGFAPFHYGRWAQLGPRWAWVPGRLAPRPVYAPALVAFVGGNLGHGGAGWNISIASGGVPQPAVGWFPLAPGEAFRPAYRVSPRYVTQINHNIVVNNTVNITPVYRYQRQPAAVTAVSRDDFARGQAVRNHWRALTAVDLGRAQLVAPGNALPQRPERREMHERDTTRVQAAAPPAAVLAARTVPGNRDEGKHEARDAHRREPPNGPPDMRRDDGRAIPAGRAAPAASPAPATPSHPVSARAAAPQPQAAAAGPVVAVPAASLAAPRETRPERNTRDTGFPSRHEPLQAAAHGPALPASPGAGRDAAPNPGQPPRAAVAATDTAAATHRAEAEQRQQQQRAQHEQARQQAVQGQAIEAARHAQARQQQEAAHQQQVQQAQAQAQAHQQQQHAQQAMQHPAPPPAPAAPHEPSPRKEAAQEHPVTRHADAGAPRDPRTRHDAGTAPNPAQ